MTRTATEWLAIPDDELPTKLAEVLTPGPWKHDWQEGFWGEPGTMNITKRCRKCELFAKDAKRGESSEHCSAPDPIDVKSWGKAIEYIRETFITDRQRSDYMTELVDMCDAAPVDYLECEEDFMLWLLFITQPRKLWIAAATSKE